MKLVSRLAPLLCLVPWLSGCPKLDAGAMAVEEGEACTATDCGGDLTGRWRFTELVPCEDFVVARFGADRSPYDVPECQGAVTALTLAIEGELERDEAGDCQLQAQTRTVQELRVDRECFLALGRYGMPEVDCPELQLSLQLEAGAGAARCSVRADVCECRIELSDAPESTTMDGLCDPGGDEIPYCVEGDVLRARAGSADGLQFTVELQRQ